MASIKFNLLKKSFSERIIDATCIYFNICEEDLKKRNRELAGIKSLLYFLLNQEAELTITEIAKKFNSSKSVVSESISKVKIQVGVYRSIDSTVKQIMNIETQLSNMNQVVVELQLLGENPTKVDNYPNEFKDSILVSSVPK